MKNPEGQVVSVSDDPLGAVAIVLVTAELACERCKAGKGCGAGLLGSQAAQRQVSARVADNLHLDRGDRVSISLRPERLLRAAAIVYGYPMSGGVLAAVVALVMGFNDTLAAFAALIGLIAGIGLARLSIKQSNCLRELTPVVVARLSPAGN